MKYPFSNYKYLLFHRHIATFSDKAQVSEKIVDIAGVDQG
jgi:hypothetical protein